MTRNGLRRALVPAVVLELIESDFNLQYLPIAADGAGIAAAAAAIAAAAATADQSADVTVIVASTGGRKAGAYTRPHPCST